MSIGISTACFYPLETELAAEYLAKNKIPCTEVFFNAESELGDYFIDMLIDIKNSANMRISAVHPMLSLAEPYMAFSEYLRRFDEFRRSFERYSVVAKRLGAKYINFHGDRKPGKITDEEYCERFMMLMDDAAQHGIILCQENVNGYRSADPEFLNVLNEYSNNKINFTLDIKQCVRAGYSVNEIISAMGSNIKHVHISDHSVASDCLLPLHGGFDFKSLFNIMDSLDYCGDYMIEVYNSAYSDYKEIISSYKRLFELKSDLTD